jgi:hypothetical protein
MLKKRVVSIEKRLAGLGKLMERPRLVFRFGDETDPPDEKAENPEERDGPIVFNMPRPSLPKGDGVLRFDFGRGEGEKK